MKKGKIIVFEGIDGSGKSTQINLLQKYFKKNKIKYKLFRYPRHETPFFGVMVDEYLNGEFGGTDSIHPKLSSLVYAMDRWESKDKLIKWKKDGYIVILDRYATSNMGHQLSHLPPAKWKDMLRWLMDLEYKVLGIPKPDRVIFLDISPKISISNLEKRDRKEYIKAKNNRDMLENINHQTKARKAYLYTAEYDRKVWKIIDCMNGKDMLPPDEIHKKVLDILGFG